MGFLNLHLHLLSLTHLLLLRLIPSVLDFTASLAVSEEGFQAERFEDL